MSFSKAFISEVIDSIRFIDLSEVDKIIDMLCKVRKNGRLFIIGSGGGAGHASHAVCDFRKICNIDAYSFENLSELTARVNDEGWNTSYIEWLKVSNFNHKDCLMVISVGGGSTGVSENLIRSLHYAQNTGAKIIGIVGRDGGQTKQLAHACILIQSKDYVTPVTEGIQSIIWHLLVSDPKLQKNKTKW